jgi:hypothetical protein
MTGINHAEGIDAVKFPFHFAEYKELPAEPVAAHNQPRPRSVAAVLAVGMEEILHRKLSSLAAIVPARPKRTY